MQVTSTDLFVAPGGTSLPRIGALDTVERARQRSLGGAHVLPLRGAPVLPMPAHVRQAVVDAMNETDPRDSRGLPELRAAIARELQRDHGLHVDSERRLLVTHGAMQGLALVLRTVVTAGDEVIVPTPTFFFDGAILEAGAKPVLVPGSEREGWSIDVEKVQAAVTPRTRAILLCNPNNPTGYLPDESTLRAIVDIAAHHGLVVISDDSWQHFTFDDNRYNPVEQFAGTWPNIVTVTSLSKYYALASWRIGYVVAPPSIIEAVERRFQWEALYVGMVPQRAATAALCGPRDWLEQEHATYQAKRDLVCEGIAASGLTQPVPPMAGAFMLVDCSRVGDSPAEIDDVLLHHGIATVRGGDMYAPETHVRLTFGSDEPVLRELVQALARVGRRSA